MERKRSAQLTPAQIKAFRRRFHLSARDLGTALRYTRGYVKVMEGGTAPISKTFQARFAAFSARMKAESAHTPADPPTPSTPDD